MTTYITGGNIKEELELLNSLGDSEEFVEASGVTNRKNELKKLYVKYRNFLKQHEPTDPTNKQLMDHLHQLMFAIFKGKVSAAKMKSKDIKNFVMQAASQYGSSGDDPKWARAEENINENDKYLDWKNRSEKLNAIVDETSKALKKIVGNTKGQPLSDEMRNNPNIKRQKKHMTKRLRL
jgi:hypothetical protein